MIIDIDKIRTNGDSEPPSAEEIRMIVQLLRLFDAGEIGRG